MLASFLCNGVIFGFINSYGTIYVAMKNRYEEDGFENSDTRASLLGSLLIGATFLMSPISGLLVDHIGIRKTAFLGGLLATLGAFLSSITLDNVSFIDHIVAHYDTRNLNKCQGNQLERREDVDLNIFLVPWIVLHL